MNFVPGKHAAASAWRWILASALLAATGFAAPLPVTAILQDGSRVVGKTDVAKLPLRISANIVTNLPLQRIQSVTVTDDGAWQLVSLEYGDPLRGRVNGRSFLMDTVLGPVELPWKVLEELRVETPASDLQWLTTAGVPGFFLKQSGEIVLTGGKAWTRQKFKLPVVVECDVMLANRVNDGTGWLKFAVQADLARRLTTDSPASARLVYGVRTKEGAVDGVILRQLHTAQDSTRRKGETPFGLAPGVWHRLRFEVGDDAMRLDLNGRQYELGGVQIPPVPVAIELSSDDNDSRWRIRNFVVR